MPTNRRYRPGRDPWPTMWFTGYVSRAQRNHFLKTPSLAKYRAGMRYFTPPVGHGSERHKLAQLPRRLHKKPGR